MKLKKLEAGRYESECGRFQIRDRYGMSGQGFTKDLIRKNSPVRWRIHDNAGKLAEPYAGTLAEAKKKIEEVMR